MKIQRSESTHNSKKLKSVYEESPQKPQVIDSNRVLGKDSTQKTLDKSRNDTDDNIGSYTKGLLMDIQQETANFGKSSIEKSGQDEQ